MTSLSETSLLAGSSGVTSGYTIDQSIRFDQNANASMSRTPSSASSRTTWTFSWWWKRGNLTNSSDGTNQRQPIFGTTAFSILSNHNSTTIDGINVVYTGSANDIQTSEQYRDVSAWYHFVFVLDTTNDISTERVRLYKNGERVTSFASITYPSKDTTYTVNNTQAHYIGLRSSGENLDGYLAEMHFLDGYAYDASYFGEFNSNGIWIPKEYEGSYGTNGFHIDGRDSGDLGDDESGNGNDFTTSGMAAHDQVLDSPTNNFCVMSSIDFTYNAIRNGNLETIGGNNNKGGRGTMGFSSGKFYWEMLATTVSDGYPGSGVVYDSYASSMPTAYAGGGTNYGSGASHNAAIWYKQSTSGTAYGSTASSGDILQYAVDRDNNKIYWGVNGTYRNSGDPAGGTGAVASSLTHYGGNNNDAWMPFVNHGSNAGTSAGTFNFGQDGTFAGAKTAQGNSDGNGVGNFFYSPPSGFLALCSKNLGS